MNKPVNTERDEEIIKERANATSAELAKKYGISRSRVNQIVKGRKDYESRMAKSPDNSIFKTKLTTRSKKALYKGGVGTVERLKDYLSNPYPIRGFGSKCLEECYELYGNEIQEEIHDGETEKIEFDKKNK